MARLGYILPQGMDAFYGAIILGVVGFTFFMIMEYYLTKKRERRKIAYEVNQI